jgi:hypothetical protein
MVVTFPVTDFVAGFVWPCDGVCAAALIVITGAPTSNKLTSDADNRIFRFIARSS